MKRELSTRTNEIEPRSALDCRWRFGGNKGTARHIERDCSAVLTQVDKEPEEQEFMAADNN